MPDDDNNLCAKIRRGEIPAKKGYEDDGIYAFHDINPQAPVHVLVIPKGRYVSWIDFTEKASDGEIAQFIRGVGKVDAMMCLTDNDYRLLSNIAQHGHQDVPHFHVHIFGGRQLGAMLPQECWRPGGQTT